MVRLIEQIIVAVWNRLRTRRRGAWSNGSGLNLGYRLQDGQITRRAFTLSEARRSTHITIVGKSGTGKSSMLRHLISQDLAVGQGFVAFDLHGEFLPFILGAVNAMERETHIHLSDKLLIIDPTDPIVSVGINPLEQRPPNFQQISEFAEILRRQWGLEGFGARTAELLRNSLYVLASAGLTLLELAFLLTDNGFRAACLKHVDNPEVRQYFTHRFDRASTPMQTTMAEPVLNKVTVFTADPRFRHVLGQVKSTVSLSEALENNRWVVVNVDKGRLGEQAITFGSLIFTMVKNAIFSRQSRTPFSIYCDEIQNFVAFSGAIETILSESRKRSVSLVSANQYLDQLPPDMRSAILSTGTQVFFRLAPSDASLVSQALDGGKSLAERLKNLPQRHTILKSGAERPLEVRVPDVCEQRVDYSNLVNRCRGTWARPIPVIEREISERQRSGVCGNGPTLAAEDELE